MPHKTITPTPSSSPAQNQQLTIDALQREVSRFEALRDSSVAQATNPEQAELARVALQADVDRVKRQLDAAVKTLTALIEADE